MKTSKTNGVTAKDLNDKTTFASKATNKLVMLMTIIAMLSTLGCGNKNKRQQSAEANSQQIDVSLQRVGTPAFGYVNIPADYRRFKDVDEKVKDLQYSDATVKTIISLNIFDKTGLTPEQAKTFTAEDAANHVWTNYKNHGALHVEGSIQKIKGYESRQLIATYNDDYQLIAWLFQAEDDEIHYICVESDTKEKLYMLASLVYESFSLKKTQ